MLCWCLTFFRVETIDESWQRAHGPARRSAPTSRKFDTPSNLRSLLRLSPLHAHRLTQHRQNGRFLYSSIAAPSNSSHSIPERHSPTGHLVSTASLDCAPLKQILSTSPSLNLRALVPLRTRYNIWPVIFQFTALSTCAPLHTTTNATID